MKSTYVMVKKEGKRKYYEMGKKKNKTAEAIKIGKSAYAKKGKAEKMRMK